MAERHCRAQMRREIFRTLGINAKSMISQWEKEFNMYAKTKRRRAHSGKDREVVKHAISQEVFEFIKGKDILHEMFHLNSDDKENISSNGARTQDMPRPPQEFNMDTLLEDMDSLLEPILMQDFDMDSLLEPIVVEDKDSLLEPIIVEDKDSPLEPNDTLIEDMDSLLEPIAFDSLIEDMDSLLEPIIVEDMDSLLEPITFDSLLEPNDTLIEDKDSLLEPIDSLVEDMDSLLEPIDALLEPIALNNPSNVDEFNKLVCRLDSLLEPVVLVERC